MTGSINPNSDPSVLALHTVAFSPRVGDIQANLIAIIATTRKLCQHNSRPAMVIFPELALIGYPPEDLLLRSELNQRMQWAIEQLQAMTQELGHVCVVVGAPTPAAPNTAYHPSIRLYNSALAIHAGQICGLHHKQELPNYAVFDERRYFQIGPRASAHVFAASSFTFAKVRFGLSVCEDIWFESVAAQAAQAEVDVLININASPFHQHKWTKRRQVLTQRVHETKVLGHALAIVYTNQIGGQDELVFDGGNCVVDADGELYTGGGSHFQQQVVSFGYAHGKWQALGVQSIESLPTRARLASYELSSQHGQLAQAIRLALHDYVIKNGFHKVLLGLSGGIDSGLTLALAVQALGASAVEAIMMPSEFTSNLSLELAKGQAQALGVRYTILAIDSLANSTQAVLAPRFAELALDVTEENIQARLRGLLLMAVSNKTGALVLTTGNKSELAVGYSTLYGDMVGAFNPLKDLFKTQVYALARYLNEHSPCIPEAVITRAPSAELRADQHDQQSLPAYEELDRILQGYVVERLSATELIAKGEETATVLSIIKLCDQAEYKRQQAPIGVRLSLQGFGRDRRLPISATWPSVCPLA